MVALKTILQEQLQNLYLIWRLSRYEAKRIYAGNVLGSAWVFLAPIMQIAVYWIVFGFGIRQGAPVHGIPFLVWMLCGLIPWFFISNSLGKGANSVHTRLNTVSKMNFPLSVIPTYIILAQLYSHVILLITLFVAIIISQGVPTWHWIGVVYGIVAAFCFLTAFAFITSTLATIVRDIALFVQSSTRMLFFLTPILWEPKETMAQPFLVLIQLNPIYYLIEVYRGALLYQDLSIIASGYTLYFWSIVLLFLITGAMMHIKFRKQFIDYL